MKPELASWSNFYVMVGSSAAALTGLMFVVITLISQIERTEASEEGLAAFGTPTVLHFCAPLFIAAILSAPWGSLGPIVILLAVVGLFGFAFIVRAMLRTTNIAYTPDLSDWIWYMLCPLIAYAVILTGAVGLLFFAKTALFLIAAAAVALMFLGIRNAWDTVTYLGVLNVERDSSSAEAEGDR
ncbi:MAG: hypothetical protein JOZ97_09195 [Candidatus Eremiobacteraeota bacterium]|nr:hypothetical protein [Candidatus Eremiobacteraeota bacterium]